MSGARWAGRQHVVTLLDRLRHVLTSDVLHVGTDDRFGDEVRCAAVSSRYRRLPRRRSRSTSSSAWPENPEIAVADQYDQLALGGNHRDRRRAREPRFSTAACPDDWPTRGLGQAEADPRRRPDRSVQIQGIFVRITVGTKRTAAQMTTSAARRPRRRPRFVNAARPCPIGREQQPAATAANSQS